MIKNIGKHITYQELDGYFKLWVDGELIFNIRMDINTPFISTATKVNCLHRILSEHRELLWLFIDGMDKDGKL